MSAPLAQVTEETLANIAKAQTTGILESTGIYSYDLSSLVTLIPVVTPFRDIVARTTSPDGNPYAVWRAIMNLTNSQPDPAMGFDYAANETVFLEQDFQARYKPTGLAGLVTQDAFDLAKGYGDPYAIATFNVLNQVLIGDDRKLMGAQSFALKQPAAPTLTADHGRVDRRRQPATSASPPAPAPATTTGPGTAGARPASSAPSRRVPRTRSPRRSPRSAVRSPTTGSTPRTTAPGTTTRPPPRTRCRSPRRSPRTTRCRRRRPARTCPPVEGHRERVPTSTCSRTTAVANANDYDGFLANLCRRLQRHRPVGHARHRHHQPVRVQVPRRRGADPDRRHRHRDRERTCSCRCGTRSSAPRPRSW